jgi:MarR family transcriptional regulator, organic hydroperoxide resistance regulator
MTKSAEPIAIDPSTRAIMRHWREAVPNDRLAHLLKDATRALTRALQIRLAEHSVSFGHWVFLRILWDADGITQRELSERAGLMEPTTYSALLAMEKLGYVERRRQPDSRKKVYVYLTPRGAGLRERLVPLAEEVNAVAVRGVRPETIGLAREMLLTMIQNLAEDEIAQAASKRRMPSTRELSNRIDRAETMERARSVRARRTKATTAG